MKKWLKLILLAVVLQAGIYIFLDRYLFLPAADFSQQLVSEGNQQALDPDKLSSDQKYLAKISPDEVLFVTADSKTVQEITLQAGETVTYFTWVPDTHLALIGIATNDAKSATVTLKPVNLDTQAQPVEPKISGLEVGSEIQSVAFSPQVNVTYMLITGKATNLVYRTDANNKLSRELSNANLDRIACLQSIDTLLVYNKLEKTIYTRSTRGTLKLNVPKNGKFSLVGADKNDYIYIGRLNSAGLVTEVLQGSIKGNFVTYQTLITPSSPESVKVDFLGQLELE